MAAATTRRKASKLVAAEAAVAYGTLQELPAAAPASVQPSEDTPASAAMAMQKVSLDQAKAAAAAAKAAGSAVGGAAAGGGGGGSSQWGAAGAAAGAVAALAGQLAGALGKKQTSGSSDRPGDPDVAYAFKLIINNVTYATFSEVSGMSWKAESIPVRSGGNNEHGYHMRGPGKFEPLTLKRGQFAANGEFFDMMKSSLAGSSKGKGMGADRVNVTITLLNRKYQPIGEYQLFNAFITEYSGLALNAMSSQVGFEQIRMAYDYFVYKSL